MLVFLKTLTKHVLEIDVPNYNKYTIENLINQIKTEFNVHDNFVLIYGGKKCDNSKTLDNYNVSTDCLYIVKCNK